MIRNLQQRRFRTPLILGYLLCVHLLLAVLIVKTDFIPKIKVKLGFAAATPDVHLPNMRRIHGWMDASVPDGAVIFLGDSIVQGLATAAVTERAINYGIGGMNTAQLVDLLPLYQSLPRASAIVLSIGINDLLGGSTAALQHRYEGVLKQLPTSVPLVWSSILPTAIPQMSDAAIQQANQVIQGLCAARPGCTYVDGWTALSTSTTSLKQLLLDDQIHLSPAGYQLWIESLRTAVNAAVAART